MPIAEPSKRLQQIPPYMFQELERRIGEKKAAGIDVISLGIGADGILLLAPSEDPAFVAALRIFNPDGSEAELSGNGAREAILYLRRHG